MAFRSALQPGRLVVAAVDFGPVICGQLGMVVARQRRAGHWPWRSVRYACVFLGGIPVELPGWALKPQDHGFSLPMLQDPFWFLLTRGKAEQEHGSAVEVRRSTRFSG